MMRMEWLLVILGSLIAIGPAALPSVAQEPPKGKDDGWKTHTSKKGGFTVEIPPGSMPEEKDQSLTIKLKGSSDTYQVSWSEIDKDDLKGKTADQILDQRRDRLVAVLKPPVKSELQVEKKIKLGKHAGREIEIKKTGIDAGGIVITDTVNIFRGRVFVAGDKLYMMYTLGKPEFASSKDTTRILESLKLSE